MTLSEINIRRALERSELEIRRDGDVHIGPSSIDLHLYPKLARPIKGSAEPVKVDKKETYPRYEGVQDMTIQPGEFLLASTDEWVSIPPNGMGFVDGRSSVGRLGLAVENAGLIDAGFQGQITLELKNQADYPITLVPDMRIAQLTLHEHVDSPGISYSKQGKYQGQEGPTPSRLYEDFEE